MNTRHGKIARLPLAIREQLNRRLQNGELSPALLPWLNQLPEVNSVLAEFFAGQPISRQNLSEWRQGGYRDWLKHQDRQFLIRRVAEEGTDLKQYEGKDDLFENFSRIAVAELFADLDALDQLEGDERWKRLRALTRELARMQHEYNRSREVELTWVKWNDRFEDENAPDEENPTAGLSQNLTDCRGVPKSHPLPSGEGRGEGERSTSNTPPTPPVGRGDLPAAPPAEPAPVKVDQTASNQYREPWQIRQAEDEKIRTYLSRTIHHRRCEQGCICQTCHPKHGHYPYSQALRNQTEAVDKGVQFFSRGTVSINITYLKCDCPCDCDRTGPVNEPKIDPRRYTLHA